MGTEFVGAFGYADDVVLLSPTVYGMREMLRICSEFGNEYNVMFNSSKSKCISMTNYNDQRRLLSACDPKLQFMGGDIPHVQFDKHLGNYVGNISTKHGFSHDQ